MISVIICTMDLYYSYLHQFIDANASALRGKMSSDFVGELISVVIPRPNPGGEQVQGLGKVIGFISYCLGFKDGVCIRPLFYSSLFIEEYHNLGSIKC